MKKEAERFDLAASVLPSHLRLSALALPEEQRARAEELRLRAGQPLGVLLPEGELPLQETVEARDLETLCDLATEFSRYAAAETMREGYLPVKGGFRVGLCGTAVMKDGINTNLKHLSSASIRISREQIGIGEPLASQLMQDGRFQSTLLLSPPGGGKTTLLRDLIRCLSEGGDGRRPLRVALIDERSELAVCYCGVPQLHIGRHTDVLDGCPKAIGIPMVLRAMNPEVIAVDEVTVEEDLRAMSMASGCGVELLATVHAATVSELHQKPLYESLLSRGVFRQAVCISVQNGERIYTREDLL